MGKVTLKSNPETYKLSNTQSDGYNKIYRHVAYKFSNIYGSKSSFLPDIFLLGYMFKYLYPLSSILQMLTSKMLVHDPEKRVKIFVFNPLQSRMDVVQENGY